jgi:hypothetical protein
MRPTCNGFMSTKPVLFDRSGAKNVGELREQIRKELETEKGFKRVEKAALKPTGQSDQGGSYMQGNGAPAPALKTRKDSSPIKVCLIPLSPYFCALIIALNSL